MAEPKQAAARPAHVRPEQVVDFDYVHPAGLKGGDVYAAWNRLREGPDIFWTPRNGGHWVVTRAEDIQYVQRSYEIFSHEVFTIPRVAARSRLPPLTVDPPDHARYRAVLNPAFRGARVSAMEDDIRELTAALIEDLRPRGGCDFLNAFARVMPVTVFLGLTDLPLDRREEFISWAVNYIDARDVERRDLYLKKIGGYLGEVLQARKGRPGDDLLSRIAQWSDTPACAGADEMLGMAILVFLGGLDTVVNMLCFTAAHLAAHPEHRRRLLADPSSAGKAAEEYIRRYGLSNTGRLVKVDATYKGVHFKAEDMVLVPIAMSSMDDRKYDRPLVVDFDREVEGHDTFGNGPHRCVGAPLARLELRIFLEEWLRLIPNFRLDPARPFLTHSGSINSVDSLHLLWDGA